MDTRALWPHQLTDVELAVLQQAEPAPLDRRPDVLVVGGGIVGVATALACLEAGLGSVVLLERGHLGAGATGGAGGLLVPDVYKDSDPAAFASLGRSSLALWRELEAASPGGVGLVDLDWLGLEPHPPGLAISEASGAEHLDPQEVAQLVPGLVRQPAGVLIRHQARVNPLRALARLALRLPCALTGVEVLGAVTHGDRIFSLTTSAGEMSPGAVVFATGGPPEIYGLEVKVPSGHVKGHVLTTVPSSLRLPGTVASLATQLEDGRLLAGGTLDVGDDSSAVRPDVIAAIWSALQAELPTVSGLRIAHQWCCFRPTHPDGLPVIDRLPGLVNAWMTSGHFRTGILMAPATGRALADWIHTGRRPSQLAGLELGRFGVSEVAR
jgi:glycine/D-amino acid oxidase-like deaminating enzyme